MHWLPVIALVTALLPAGQLLAANQEGTAEDQHGGRLEHVRSLIEESSAAKRIEQGNSDEARAQRARARDLHQQALAAHADGKHELADDLLAQATRVMFDAVRLADYGGESKAKKNRDFEARAASVDALRSAFERICDEKACTAADRNEVLNNIDQKLARASALRESGDIDSARASLDEAYIAIKVAVEHQRSGDTLVRSLTFASKEEEYHYEVDRNDTHQMLIKLLLEEKGRGKSAAVEAFLQQAAALRTQAEQEAAAGDYETAVRSLESSTRELVKALRRSGIYIPG